uniref:Protein V2 n=1 Tax=Squash leaf curl China virus TaxID=223323 RepID=A0A6B9QRT9_9GEMI|nr:pre-coat protein [Squash leaf curl China virus]
MWDPLLDEFPESGHGLRWMVTGKYLPEKEKNYSPEPVGYDLVRNLVLVLRAKNYGEATSRYHHFTARIEGPPTSPLRQALWSSCGGPLCPRHKNKGLDQQADEQKTQNVQNV